MTLIGYARVSGGEQDPTLQQIALHEVGCERIFTDRASGARTDRPQLTTALDYLRAGDTLVVWRLDRLGRSLTHLIATLDALHERGIQFASITEGMDTSTAQGKLLYQLLGAFAEFERELIRERVMAGLRAARASGRRGGRRPVLDQAQVRYVRRQYEAGVPVAELKRQLQVSRPTIYRALAGASAPAAAAA